MPKWEYVEVVRCGIGSFTNRINALSEGGWELVSFVRSGSDEYVGILKRKRMD